jgi:hypothetical protein
MRNGLKYLEPIGEHSGFFFWVTDFFGNCFVFLFPFLSVRHCFVLVSMLVLVLVFVFVFVFVSGICVCIYFSTSL